MALELDRKGLATFLRQGEGRAPPVCVGRDALIDQLGKIARDGGGAPKNTQILQGAPGAGKSTILTEMLKRCTEGGAWEKTGPRVVVLQSSHLIENMESVINIIKEAAEPDPRWWQQRVKDWLERMDFGIQAFGVGVQGGLRAPEPMDTFPDLDRGHPLPPETPPIIVAIDEAQIIPVQPESSHNAFLLAIHAGQQHRPTTLPATLVLAGLGDTDARASAIGLTRGLKVHLVGGLAPGDDTTLMIRFCEHFGINCDGFETQLDRLAGPCERWPRHLHFALCALGQEVLATNDECLDGPGSLDRVDWARMGVAAATSRRDHYHGQQSSPMKDSAALVGAVLEAVGQGDNKSTVIDAIRTYAGRLPEETWQIPKGMDAHSLADHLFHQGALQMAGKEPSREEISVAEDKPVEEILISPIPSFRTYLVEAGRQAESRRQLRISWNRQCSLLAAVQESAASLAGMKDITTSRARAAAQSIVESINTMKGIEAPDVVDLAGKPLPPLPGGKAERGVAYLEQVIGDICAAAQRILNGKDDSRRTEVLDNVMECIGRARERSESPETLPGPRDASGDAPIHGLLTGDESPNSA